MRKAWAFRFNSFFPVLAFVAAMSWAAASGAQPASTEPVPPLNVLDGKRFVGELVAIGESSGPPDDFVFADGKFHSRECLKWGFAPGPYWVRLENGRLHFMARLTSDENGVMTYQGTVDGSKIDARIEWVKPRWYWTMEKNFRFRGTRGEAADRSGN